MNKIIEGNIEIPFPVWHQVCDAFLEDKDINSAYNLIEDWHISSIKQILTAEVDRLEKMKRIGGELISTPLGFDAWKRDNYFYNLAIQEQITNLTNTINNINKTR